MYSLKRPSADGNERLEGATLRIKRTRVEAPSTEAVLTLPSVSGTLALISDITGGGSGGFVTVSDAQTITGAKLFSNTMTASSNIESTGASSYVSIANTALSNSSTTGALRVAGGAYFGAGCLFGSSLSSTDTNGLLNSNITNCGLRSTPSGGGGEIFVDTQSSSAFNGTLLLPTLAASSTYTLPSTTGTLALTSQIPSLSDTVTLSTAQAITGAKLFSNTLTASSNIESTGASSYVSIANTALASNSTTGALRVAGGAYFGAGCLFGSYLTSSDFFGVYASNITNCGMRSFPSGGGGRFLIDTQSSAAFDGTLLLPSLASAAVYTFPSATTTLVGRDIVETLTNKRLLLSNGGVSAPAITFVNDGANDTGLYWISDGIVGFCSNGVPIFQFNASQVLSQFPFVSSATASATTPAFSPTAGTGMYAGAANQLNFSTGNTSRVTITTSTITNTIPIRAASGSVSSPAYGFTSGSTSGFFYTGTLPAIAAAGVQAASFNTTGIISPGFGCTTGKRIIWMDQGTSSVVASITSGNGTGSATITFNSTAPNTTGMMVSVQPTSGSGLDKLTYGAFSYTTLGCSVAAANPSATNATSIQFTYTAFVFA